MRRGCISLGDVSCDVCGHLVPYPERYLVVDEEKGAEVEKGQQVHYCLECALKKGYAHHREEKGSRILSFFADTDY